MASQARVVIIFTLRSTKKHTFRDDGCYIYGNDKNALMKDDAGYLDAFHG